MIIASANSDKIFALIDIPVLIVSLPSLCLAQYNGPILA